jgi:hypothetical protein
VLHPSFTDPKFNASMNNSGSCSAIVCVGQEVKTQSSVSEKEEMSLFQQFILRNPRQITDSFIISV